MSEHSNQQIATFPNLSFYYDEKINGSNMLTHVVDVYTNVTIISHEGLQCGTKIPQITIVLSYHFENEDGSPYKG